MSEIDIEAEEEVTIAMAYPELTPEQQEEAAYHLDRYIAAVRRIFERIHRDDI